jgi:hypothetical protein
MIAKKGKLFPDGRSGNQWKYSPLWGFPDFVKAVESSYFCYLGPYAKFRNPWTTFEITSFSAQKYHSARGRGGPPIIFLIGILIYTLLRSPCKDLKAYDNPFWDFE